MTRDPGVVLGRPVHEHVDVPAREPECGGDHEAGDEERRDRVAGLEAGRRGDQAGENGERAGEVAPEVERVGEERVAAIQTRSAERHQRPRGVDGEDEPDRRERPPRRIDLELDDAGEPQDRGDRDPDADEDEEPGLRERSEVLGLRVPVRVAAIRRTNRNRHREEREQRGREVGARVRRLGEQPETRAGQPDDELDHHEETRSPDRDERSAALRRHGGRLRRQPVAA